MTTPHSLSVKISLHSRWSVGLFVLLLAYHFTLFGEPAENIDTSIRLEVGPWRVSDYRLEKHLSRFLSESAASVESSAETKQQWLEHMLVQQVLIAKAFESGYTNRPEVLREVNRMERNMLTQTQGPFYERLVSSTAITESELESARRQYTHAYKVEIDWLSEDAARSVTDDGTLSIKTTAEPERQMLAWRKDGRCRHFEGELFWPCEPFSELAPEFEASSLQILREGSLASGDKCWFRVLSVRNMSHVVPEQSLSQILLAAKCQQIIRQHRAEVIRATKFAFNWTEADEYLRELVGRRPSDETLPLPLGERAPTAVLARFERHGQSETFSGADFASYFNDLYVRQFPASVSDLREQVTDAVIGRMDFEEANRIGIPQTPKFREDRLNYCAYVALDLFERETIRPTLGISPDTIAGYYERHKAEYVRPTRIKGRLLTFGDITAAENCVKNLGVGKEESLGALSSETLELVSDMVLPTVSFLPTLVFAAHREHVLGPFPRGSQYLVWIKEKNLEETQLTPTEVQSQIRSQLESARLAPAELQLARHWALAYQIADHIDYAKFGGGAEISKPWKP